MSRKRRRRKVGKHISLSATDADWETVRSNANRRGLSIARYLVELVERDASEEDAGPALPTPGPPVITETFEASAARTASAWPGARVSAVFCSTQGSALSGSIRGQGGLPAAISRRRPAIARSARCRTC